MKKLSKNDKKIVGIVGLVFLVAVAGIFLWMNNGKTSEDKLQSLDIGSSTEKTIEYLGKPYKKTIDKDEIMDWAPDLLNKASNDFPQLEMYYYKYEDGKEAKLFFSQNQLIYKHPLRLNLTDEEYLDMMNTLK